MSRRVGQMVHTGSGLTAEIYEGFCWPAFFFGPLWYLAKGMWGFGLVYLFICFTGIGWVAGLFIAPFVANRHYREHLGSNGYVVARRGASASS